MTECLRCEARKAIIQRRNCERVWRIYVGRDSPLMWHAKLLVSRTRTSTWRFIWLYPHYFTPDTLIIFIKTEYNIFRYANEIKLKEIISNESVKHFPTRLFSRNHLILSFSQYACFPFSHHQLTPSHRLHKLFFFKLTNLPFTSMNWNNRMASNWFSALLNCHQSTTLCWWQV